MMEKTTSKTSQPSLSQVLMAKDSRARVHRSEEVRPSHKQLVVELREVIKHYLHQNAIRSLAGLAKASKIPDSSVRRVMQGESVPNLATVIAILRITSSRSEIKAFLSKHYPRPTEYFDTVFYHPHSMSEESEGLNVYLNDEVALCIMKLCASRQEISIENLKERFGAYGLERLEGLMAMGVIYENHKGLLAFQQMSARHKSLAHCLRMIQTQTKMFHPHHLGTCAAMLSSVSESVSLQGLEQIKGHGVAYVKKVVKILREHPGDLPVYVAVIQNVYDSELLAQERLKAQSEHCSDSRDKPIPPQDP